MAYRVLDEKNYVIMSSIFKVNIKIVFYVEQRVTNCYNIIVVITRYALST